MSTNMNPTADALAQRIANASCTVDGVAALIQDSIVAEATPEDMERSRRFYALADLLERVGDELSELEVSVRKFGTHVEAAS